MNKMRVIYIIWAGLVLALIIALTILGFGYQKSLKPYKDLEVKLTEAAKKYVELKFIYPETGEVLTIKSEDLVNENVLRDLSYNGDSCTGYVKLTYNGVYNYNSYVKCNNYETKGY
ncbi:MAG: hypothetical protein IJN03_02065 [Bacilli bacterium]|nr:hypothetical protein [Bacilli bacterium]